MSHVSLGRKLVATMFLLLAFISFGVGIAVIFGYQGLATSSDLAESAARADCRSEYRARIEERKDVRVAIISQVVVASVSGDGTHVGELAAELDVLNAEIDSLPRVDQAVDRGWMLDGVRYPPCPG